MNTSVVEISQYELLTKFMCGLDPQEALLIVGMTARGCDVCIVNDNDDALLITRWYLIRDSGSGQLFGVDERNYEAYRANNFKPID